MPSIAYIYVDTVDDAAPSTDTAAAVDAATAMIALSGSLSNVNISALSSGSPIGGASGSASTADNKASMMLETVTSTDLSDYIPPSSLNNSESGRSGSVCKPKTGSIGLVRHLKNRTEEIASVAEAVAAITGKSINQDVCVGDNASLTFSPSKRKGDDKQGKNSTNIEKNKNSNLTISQPSQRKNEEGNDKPRNGGVRTKIRKNDHDKNESTGNSTDDTIKNAVLTETNINQEYPSKDDDSVSGNKNNEEETREIEANRKEIQNDSKNNECNEEGRDKEQLDQIIDDNQGGEVRDNKKVSSQTSASPPPAKALSETSAKATAAITSSSSASETSDHSVENNGDDTSSPNLVESDTSNMNLNNNEQNKEKICTKKDKEKNEEGTRQEERKEQRNGSDARSEQDDQNNIFENEKKDGEGEKAKENSDDEEEIERNKEVTKSPSSSSFLSSSENNFDEMEKPATNKRVVSDEAMETASDEKSRDETNEENNIFIIAGDEDDLSINDGPDTNKTEDEESRGFKEADDWHEMGANRVTRSRKTSSSDEMNNKQTSPRSPRSPRKKVNNIEKALRFQEDKQRIMSSIPMEIVSDFKEIGFTKWDGRYLCILQLGPYDVSPGEVRDKWMQMFKERSENGRPFSRLVYWYGADMSQAYSLVAKSKILPYEEGVKRGLQNIPQDITRKMKKRRRLSAKENFIVENRKAANNDLALPPSERSLWLFDFAEEHEEDDEDEGEEDGDENSVVEVGSNKGENDNDEAMMNEDSNDDNDGTSNVRTTRSRKNSMAWSVTNESHEIQSPLHAKLQGGENKKRRSHHSSPGNEKIHGSVKYDNQNQRKKARHNHEVLADVVDLRVLLKPISADVPSNGDDDNDNDDNVADDGKKRYNLQIVQNGALISESELQFSDPNESVTQQLKNQNITLNFAFKL